MRIALCSLVSIGALALGCGDDSSTTGTTFGPGPTTSATSDTSTVDITTSGLPSMTGSDDAMGSSDGADTGSSDGSADGSSDGDSGSTGPAVQCGDGVAEGDEVCDGDDVGADTCMSQGFDGGTLACAADCTGYDTGACFLAMCGDGVVEGAEVCDGVDLAGATCMSEGFTSGTLACTDDCLGFETGGCGLCGNVIVDGEEVCDGVALLGETCDSQGFEYGEVACNADCMGFDTAACGLCGDGSLGGAEDCDGPDLGGEDCISLGGTGGVLACSPTCTYDLTGCDLVAQQYDVSAPNTSSNQTSYFRSHGYNADGDGQLVDFEVYLNLTGPCDLDFYVFEAPAFGGPYTQVERTTVNSGPGLAYYPAMLPVPVPITNGNYYITGVGWNCTATYYWDGSGTYAGHDAGIGIYNVSHWDNSYPGASDMYVPPNTGGGNTAYVHRYFFAG